MPCHKTTALDHHSMPTTYNSAHSIAVERTNGCSVGSPSAPQSSRLFSFYVCNLGDTPFSLPQCLYANGFLLCIGLPSCSLFETQVQFQVLTVLSSLPSVFNHSSLPNFSITIISPVTWAETFGKIHYSFLSGQPSNYVDFFLKAPSEMTSSLGFVLK